MRAIPAIVSTLVVLAMALSTGWELLFRLFYTMGWAILISFAWSWGNVRWLRFRHELRSTRAQVGGEIKEELTLENSSWIPKLWLEIRYEATLQGHRGNRVAALGAYAKRSFTLVTPCRVRGVFNLGPAAVASGDPFGLFSMQRKLPVSETVVVYPAITPLASFGKLAGELPGGGAQRHRTHFTTPNASGVRDYQPGDALRRIHWPSSVRHSRLMVKEFELDPLSEVWLVLDLHSDVQLGSGADSTEEWAVSVAATIANYYLGKQREVGIVTQGTALPADRGDRQLQKILEMLAVVRSASNVPLEELMAAEGSRFPRGSTAVIVTPSADERWLVAGDVLLARGVTVIAVLLDALSFGGKRSGLSVVGSLAFAGVQTYVVRKGDDLGRALGRTE